MALIPKKKNKQTKKTSKQFFHQRKQNLERTFPLIYTKVVVSLCQKNDFPSGYSVRTRTRRVVSWILTRSSEFFVSFWSWNSSSLKLYRSFDSSAYSILKKHRLCHSPSFAALIMVIASFPHLFVAIFRSVPEKKSYPHL